MGVERKRKLPEEEEQNLRKVSQWYNQVGFEYDLVAEDKRDYEKAIAFLQRAEKDVKSANLLYKSKQYEDAVFHIQQAVEKTGKSILITSGFCVEEELRRKMGHEFVTYLLKKIRKILSSFNDYSPDKNYTKFIRRIDKFLSEYSKKRRRTNLYPSYDKLKENLMGYNKFSETLVDLIKSGLKQDFTFEYDEETDDFFNIVIDEREKYIGKKVSAGKKENLKKSYVEEYKKRDVQLELINTIVIIILLIAISFLSVNLEKHVSESRYPQETEYNEESDIVRICPLMLDTIDKIIDDFYYILSLNLTEDKTEEDSGKVT